MSAEIEIKLLLDDERALITSYVFTRLKDVSEDKIKELVEAYIGNEYREAFIEKIITKRKNERDNGKSKSIS